VILDFTWARKLDLWLEDSGITYQWEASAGKTPEFRLSRLPQLPKTRISPDGGHDHGPDNLFEKVIALLDEAGNLLPGSGRSRNESFSYGDDVIVPFEIEAQHDGVLRLSAPQPDPSTGSRRESYSDLAQLLGVAISNRRTRAALMERVKELDCMYRIAHIAAEPNIALADVMQEIAELLPMAWQYPKLAAARITVGDNVYCSTGFGQGPYRLSTDITRRDEFRGTLEVFYRETRTCTFDDIQLLGEAPFLDEEHHLMEGVARELNSIIDHKNAEQEKLQMLNQLRRADRLMTIGQLAAGVAHELNEPLGNILGFAQLAIKAPGLPVQARSDIEKIEKASLYAREIIRKLMFFSRQAPSHRVDFSLRDVVEDSLSLLATRCEATGIDVVQDLDPELASINGDPSQLQQVTVNLVVNAIQAMPDGGTLTIRTSKVGDRQCLTVEDTGSGIAADDIKNIFLPFFTTKEVGEGTGLGLAVVHGIVKSHGGSVDVESELCKGTKFVVWIPVKSDSKR